MNFLQSRIAEWFSRGLNNGPNLMHNCESTSLCLFNMKTHINVCTDHCCANFFLSHVKLSCSLMRKHHWEALLADPETPGWVMPQAGHSHQLRILTWAGACRERQTGFSGCCCSLWPQLLWGFQLCNFQWFGVNLCRFSSCQDTIPLSPFPMSQQWGEAQLPKQTPAGYKQAILNQL